MLGEGADTVFLDGGFAPCLDAIETQGTTPPLDTLRRESMGIRITGDVASAAPIEVVEYFHAGFGHYFMTALPAEIALLDGGGFGGAFARTGSTFKVYDGPGERRGCGMPVLHRHLRPEKLALLHRARR